MRALLQDQRNGDRAHVVASRLARYPLPDLTDIPENIRRYPTYRAAGCGFSLFAVRSSPTAHLNEAPMLIADNSPAYAAVADALRVIPEHLLARLRAEEFRIRVLAQGETYGML